MNRHHKYLNINVYDEKHPHLGQIQNYHTYCIDKAGTGIFLCRQSIRTGDNMSLRRLAIPFAAVLAIVAIGAATTTALVAARGQQPETLPPASIPPAQAGTPVTPTPASTVVINFEVPPKTALDPASLPDPKPVTENTGPKPAPKAALDRGPKGNRIPLGPVQEASSQPLSETADSSGKDAGGGNVYTWQDGDRTMNIVLQDDLVAQSKSGNTPKDTIVAEGGGYSILSKQYQYGSGDQPVFKSESGGGLMTLPGGVMLVLDPEWDQAAVDKFFEGNGIKPDQVSELGFLDNAFFVETDAGFPSLDLANALAGKEGVTVSSPNWWRQLETK